MKIRFFEENLSLNKKAIGPGIYMIKIGKVGGNDLEYKPLYIGKSYSMMIRCSTHLYELHKDPSYFGLKEGDFSKGNLELIAEIYESVEIDKHSSAAARDKLLREKELKAIKKLKPLSQLETSDRLNSQRVDIVQSFLEELLREDGA